MSKKDTVIFDVGDRVVIRLCNDRGPWFISLRTQISPGRYRYALCKEDVDARRWYLADDLRYDPDALAPPAPKPSLAEQFRNLANGAKTLDSYTCVKASVLLDAANALDVPPMAATVEPSTERQTRCEFINEIGNKIVVEVIAGIPDALPFFSITGPHSRIESYVTLKEMRALADMIGNAIGPAAPEYASPPATEAEEESAPAMLERLGDDARKWAEEFIKTFPSFGTYEEMLSGWFANAIESSNAIRAKRLVDRLRVELGNSTADHVPDDIIFMTADSVMKSSDLAGALLHLKIFARYVTNSAATLVYPSSIEGTTE